MSQQPSAIYLGIVVTQEIQNRQKYDQAIKELSLFLKTHNHEIHFEIDDRWIRVRLLEGQSELNIPINCGYLRTSYFRISTEETDEEKDLIKFCEIAWECCCILKENFPSRIELFQENLDQYINIEEGQFSQEMLRRQINAYLNKISLNEQLKKDEIQDIFAILNNSISLLNFKGVKTCLELLESELCPPCLLQQIHSQEIQLLESIDSSEGVLKQSLESELLIREYQEIRSLASSILCKILKAKNHGDNTVTSGNNVIQSLKKFEVGSFSQPAYKHSYLFQLKESCDIERVTFILDSLLGKHLNLLEELDQIGLGKIISRLLVRYSEGELGIDFSEVTQYCLFHNRILKYLQRTLPIQPSSTFNIFMTAEICPSMLQLIEEGVLNLLKNEVNLNKNEKYERDQFLKSTLQFYQTLLSQPHLLSEVFKRLLRSHLASVKEITNSYLGIGSPDDLSVAPRDFRHFYVSVTTFLDKADYSLPSPAIPSHSQYDNLKSALQDGENSGDISPVPQQILRSSSNSRNTSRNLSNQNILKQNNFKKHDESKALDLPRQPKYSPKNVLQQKNQQYKNPAGIELDVYPHQEQLKSPSNNGILKKTSPQQQERMNPFLQKQSPYENDEDEVEQEMQEKEDYLNNYGENEEYA